MGRLNYKGRKLRELEIEKDDGKLLNCLAPEKKKQLASFQCRQVGLRRLSEGLGNENWYYPKKLKPYTPKPYKLNP